MKLSPPDPRAALAAAKLLLSLPTAPYHEHRVRTELRRFLSAAGIRSRTDAYGNLIARYRRGKAAPIAFAAHMDHPGFEIISCRGESAAARWNGQVPPFDMRGLELALWSADGRRRRGCARVLDGDGRRPRARAARLCLRVPAETRAGDFGYADVTPFRLSGNRIVGKSLDNGGGCAAIAATLAHLASRRLPGDVTALFTRAEEVGFLGAAGAISGASVPPTRPLIVLECSREMPGAVQGAGPVIRVGDRLRVFDPDLILACEETARALAKRRSSFCYQRRLMDGGACESSLFSLSGYRTACLAFPLRNYHNIGRRGLAAECIDRRDFINGVDCLAAFSALGVHPAPERRRTAAAIRRRIGSPDRLKESA
ncbi:MAG: M28 family peptidase [Elusimicrobiota bacterium]